MDHLTNLYRHRAEQLQEQINILESKLKSLLEAPQISDAAADFNQEAMRPGQRYVVDKSGFVQSYNPQTPKAAPTVPSPKDFNRSAMEPGKVYTVSKGGYAQSDVNAPENRPAPESAPAPTRNAGVSPTGRGTTPNAAAQMAGGVSKALDDVRRGMPSLASDNRTLSYLPKQTAQGAAPQATGNQSGSNWSDSDIAAGNKFFDDFQARFGGAKPAAPSKPSYDFGQSSGQLVSMTKGLLDKFGTGSQSGSAPTASGAPSTPAKSDAGVQGTEITPRITATDDPKVSKYYATVPDKGADAGGYGPPSDLMRATPGSLTAPQKPAPTRVDLNIDTPENRREVERQAGLDPDRPRTDPRMFDVNPDITVDPETAARYRKQQAMQRVRETEAERPDMMPASINPDGPGDRRYDSIEDMRARRVAERPGLGVMRANSPRERRELEARALGYTVPGDEQQAAPATPPAQAQSQMQGRTSGRTPMMPGNLADFYRQLGLFK